MDIARRNSWPGIGLASGNRREARAVSSRLGGCAVFLALLSFSCVFETATPVPAEALRLDYTVTPPDPSAKSIAGAPAACRVEIRIRSWPPGRAKIFQAPVYYGDNPVMPLRGFRAADLTVFDRQSRPLSARDTLPPGLSLNGNFIALPDSAHTFSYRVDFDPKDPDRFGIPMPGVGKGVDMVDGAYFFILPLLGSDYPSQWRTPGRFELEFRSVPGRTLVGTDAKRSLATNYELMFLRAAWNPVRSHTLAMPGHAVTVYATSSDSMDLARFGGLLVSYIRLVEDSLMPLPTYRYFVGENPQFWGIEGIQGYWFKEAAQDLPVVHVHELTHTFVGVYHGDYEDPWWKEGVTDYIGLLLSIQAGLIGDTAFAAEILHSYDTLSAVKAHALSSPFLRDHLFATMDSAFVEPYVAENYVGLVYGKGGQAAMILDRYLLEKSGGKASLYDLVRALVRGHGTAFRRSDLIAAVDRLAGGTSVDFLGRLLDRADPLGVDSLANTYKALRARGRFGPGGGKQPIPGIDAAPKAAFRPSSGEAGFGSGIPRAAKR